MDFTNTPAIMPAGSIMQNASPCGAFTDWVGAVWELQAANVGVVVPDGSFTSQSPVPLSNWPSWSLQRHWRVPWPSSVAATTWGRVGRVGPTGVYSPPERAREYAPICLGRGESNEPAGVSVGVRVVSAPPRGPWCQIVICRSAFPGVAGFMDFTNTPATMPAGSIMQNASPCGAFTDWVGAVWELQAANVGVAVPDGSFTSQSPVPLSNWPSWSVQRHWRVPWPSSVAASTWRSVGRVGPTGVYSPPERVREYAPTCLLCGEPSGSAGVSAMLGTEVEGRPDGVDAGCWAFNGQTGKRRPTTVAMLPITAAIPPMTVHILAECSPNQWPLDRSALSRWLLLP